MNLRGKVTVELSVIAILTAIFLLVFPKRNPLVDVALAAFALLSIVTSTGYTMAIWSSISPPVVENRRKRCVVLAFWITVPLALMFLTIGGVVAYKSGGWSAVPARCCNWGMLVALGFYLPWAFMQQALLQFYLLGRLLVLFPARLYWIPLIITGMCFGLVHYPDAITGSVTVVTGIIWSFMYLRYRLLLPLALSHAILGTAFYYGLFGQNLAKVWLEALP